MSEARDARVIEESRRQIERLSKLGWYHSIELPGGSVIEGHQTIQQLRTRLRQFPIPEDLTGKRVLDIGAWDGWFSFEMERRGAQVVALDSTRARASSKRRSCSARASNIASATSAGSPRRISARSISCCFWACSIT